MSVSSPLTNPAYLVGIGGAAGALLRYATSQYVGGRVDAGQVPYATFAVNVVGSFILGVVTFLGAAPDILSLVGTGACGAYTTFSSFSVDTVRLWEGGNRSLAGWYAGTTLVGALGAIGAARILTLMLT